MTKTRLIWVGLVASLTATGAVAATQQHFATASTKKEAKRLATAEARATAQATASCYRPARQVQECQAVDGGFRCKAETSTHYSTCKRVGWVNEYALDYTASRYDPWRTNAFTPYSTNIQAAPTSSLYGRWMSSDGGPPAATPFPPSPSN